MKTEDFALNLRRRVFEHTIGHNGGYLSQACSAADMLARLHNEVPRLSPPIPPGILTPDGITQQAMRPITAADLEEVKARAVHSVNKAEAL